jgi:tetratricopeptide (TPR) repeat protein
MTRSFLARGLGRMFAVALAVGVAGSLGATAACGGKDKKDTTTPGTGSGSAGTGDPTDPGGMGSGSDPGGLDPGGGGTDPGGGGTDPGGGGTDPGGGGTGEPTVPEIVPPNLDPDPAAARAQVQQHLDAARAALRRTPADGDAALASAKQALAIDASSVDAAVMVAHAYYAKKLIDTAETILDDVFRRESAKKNAGVYFVYGLIYDSQGKLPEAFLAYQQAVSYDPRHASAYVNLGVHQLRNKQYDRAIDTYERLTQTLGVTTAAAYSGLGAAYRGRTGDFPPTSSERSGLLRKAETALKQAVSVDRNYAPAYYNLGVLYLDAKPFPGEGGNLDELARLQRAKTYFDEYKSMPGADQAMYEARNKDVGKAIKREERDRKAAAAGGDE